LVGVEMSSKDVTPTKPAAGNVVEESGSKESPEKEVEP